MSKTRFLATAFVTVSLAAGVPACGSDDEGKSGATHGTCDLRNDHFSCIERNGTAAAIEDQKQGCLDAGGSWSNDPCPSEDLVGCCSYTFGDEFHECFYVGSTVDGPTYCAMDL